MMSSQITLPQKFGIIISTAYESTENVMTENVDYAKKILDGLIDKDDVFALLFEPDNPKEWTEDEALYQANPLALEVETIKNSVFEKRQKAIDMPSSMTNFLTKHMNIFTENLLEVYIALDDLRKCKIQNGSYNWKDKEVYVGIDFSLTTDNCGIAMTTYDKDLKKDVCKAWAFYPADKEDEKSNIEKVPYDRLSRQGYCFPCGNRIVDYGFMEQFILDLEKEYGVKIKCVTYDKYNAMSSVSKLETALPYAEMREQVQYSKHLHIGTKRLREVVLEEKFLYEENQLLEINFQNAKLDTDTALNQYVNKKKSTGRIDMLDAIINNMCSMVVDEIEGESVYESREGFIFF